MHTTACRLEPQQDGQHDLPLFEWASTVTAHPAPAAEAPAQAPAANGPVQCASASDAVMAVAGWSDLSVQRRRDLQSSLRGVARCLGRPPETVLLQPGALSADLARIEPATFGFTPQRFSVMVANLRFVMRRLGLIEPRQNPDAPALTPEWQDLLKAGAKPSARRAVLRRFAGFAAAAGLSPRLVSDDTLAQFNAADREARLSTSKNPAASAVARAWNDLRERDPGLDLPVLRPPRRRQGYTLPMSAFPESFAKDVDAFLARLSAKGGGRFAMGSDGPRRAARPATVRTRAFLLRQAASILVLRGRAPESIRGLRDLVEPPENPSEILEWLADRQAARLAAEGKDADAVGGGQLGSMAETLRQIAKHHVKLPEAQVKRFAIWAAKASPSRPDGLTDKNRQLLRKFIQPRVFALFLHLPAELRRRAAALRKDEPEHAARLMRSAAAIELVTVFPIRRESLRSLLVDQHLLRLDPASPSRVTHLVVPERLTKNRVALELRLPRSTADLLNEYLVQDRPVLAPRDQGALFPASKSGATMNAAGFAATIADTIARETGVRIHLHLLRHLAAYIYLKHHPGQMDDVRRILGHRDIATTYRYYAAFQEFAAAERFDAVILAERQATKAMAAAARGKTLTRPGRKASQRGAR